MTIARNIRTQYTLYHEISYYSMKLCPIVISASCKFSKIPACNWYMFPIQLNHDFPHSIKLNVNKTTPVTLLR